MNRRPECTSRLNRPYPLHSRREDTRHYRNAVLRITWCARCQTLLATSWEPAHKETP